MSDDNDRDARHWFAAYMHEVEQHRRDEEHYRWHVDALQKRCAELLERARRAEAPVEVPAAFHDAPCEAWTERMHEDRRRGLEARAILAKAGVDDPSKLAPHGFDLSGPSLTWEEIGTEIRQRQTKRIAELEAQVERLRAVCKKHRDAMGQLMARNADDVASAKAERPIREQVEEFHHAMGQPVLTTPQVPDAERVRLRLSLIAEEFCELLEALSNSETATQRISAEVDWLLRYWMPVGGVDLVAFTDALADLDYVIEGTRLEFGIDGAPIAAEVHRSNMAKTGGEVREDGKLLKPADWTPPDIAGELRKQGWQE